MNAPIALFVYNRLDHCRQTVEALIANEGSKNSELFIFSDSYKSETDKHKVEAVRSYISSLATMDYFKAVTVIKAEQNKGLAASIIAGVSQIVDKYGKIIVLEDDVVTKINFLTFMNSALDYYEQDQRIWSIGGFNTIGQSPDGKDIYFAQRICSCSWATWADRWNRADWNMKSYSTFRFNPFKRIRFSQYGNDCAIMLDEQHAGFINSWAIRFNYSAFENNMYTVYPSNSLAKNIGYDGSGTHCEKPSDNYVIQLNDDVRNLELTRFAEPLEEVKHRYQKLFSSSWSYATIHWAFALLGIRRKKH